MTNRRAGYSLIRFALNSLNARSLAGFYGKALGAVITHSEGMDSGSFGGWPEHGHARGQRIVLLLGDTVLEILEWDVPGAPYPGDLSPYDPRFQHVAVVVSDMTLAMQGLLQVPGWAPISTEGPETLPPSAGSVVAFKFRDPDGHPLELLQFPREKTPVHWQCAHGIALFRGIDHSAISIRSIDSSVEFYHSLGLELATRTLNQGQEQQRLDGIGDPHLDVIGLSPPTPTPHVELLHYRAPTPFAPTILAHNDIAATRLVFSRESNANAVRGKLIRDPDGHFIELLN